MKILLKFTLPTKASVTFEMTKISTVLIFRTEFNGKNLDIEKKLLEDV